MISKPDLSFEKELWPFYSNVAALDEAGRGALAGPVCVGAVILPHDAASLARTLRGVRDSKQMTPRGRRELAPKIRAAARASAVGFASAEEIDALGIVAATRRAAYRALEACAILPQYLLTDFRLELPDLDVPQTALVRGDQLSLSIAAASILAKTARDELMIDLDSEFYEYGFSHHKGYGTLTHRRQILALGYTAIHRKSFVVKLPGD